VCANDDGHTIKPITWESYRLKRLIAQAQAAHETETRKDKQDNVRMGGQVLSDLPEDAHDNHGGDKWPKCSISVHDEDEDSAEKMMS